MIRRAQGGDADALGMLWREYQHLLLRYFRAKGMPEPEDLASKVWIEVASSLSRFEGTEHDFRRWLFTIAARRRIDDIRSIKRRERNSGGPAARMSEASSPSAGEVGDRARSLDRALELVAALPTAQREAVTLRIIADLSISEVAAIMGRREGTVRVLVHRGLKRLSDDVDVTDRHSRTMSSP